MAQLWSKVPKGAQFSVTEGWCVQPAVFWVLVKVVSITWVGYTGQDGWLGRGGRGGRGGEGRGGRGGEGVGWGTSLAHVWWGWGSPSVLAAAHGPS